MTTFFEIHCAFTNIDQYGTLKVSKKEKFRVHAFELKNELKELERVIIISQYP